jgi:hypothetical protein
MPEKQWRAPPGRYDKIERKAFELPPIVNWKAAYDRDDSVIYLLDADWKIVRCNPAWDRFALANRGDSAVAAKVVGTAILDVVPRALRDFYCAAYNNVQQFQREWWHNFECSSPTLQRVYQMRILPCDMGELLTINTLVSESPHQGTVPKPVEEYATSDGIVTMCSNCRRVRRLRQPTTWDWVPELLLSGEVLRTFGLCEFCTAYHYHLQ